MIKKSRIVICLLLLGIILSTQTSSASMRTDRINKVLDVIVDVCTENWKEYHGYPTTCAMMAAQESLFGKAGRQNNLWGLGAGRNSYGSLEAGVIAWLECLNNGHYGSATDADNCDEQLRELLAHGYCQPPGSYYSAAQSLKEMFNLGTLDKRMFKELKRIRQKILKQRRKHRQKKQMTLQFDPSLSPWEVITYRGVVKSGTLRFKNDDVFMNWQWMDVTNTKKGNKLIIYTGNKILAMMKPSIYLAEVVEEAVG